MGTYEWKPFTQLVSAEEVEKEVLKIGDRVKYVGSNGYYNPQRLGKFGVVRDRFDDISVNVISESGDLWHGVYEQNLEVVKNAASRSPLRTVTRREIIPGVYGRIKITGTYQGNRVTMDWDRNDIITAAVPIVGMSAEELREAAHLFNQLAEALEENGK